MSGWYLRRVTIDVDSMFITHSVPFYTLIIQQGVFQCKVLIYGIYKKYVVTCYAGRKLKIEEIFTYIESRVPKIYQL